MNDFTNAVTCPIVGKPILVYFRGCKEQVEYSMGIFDLLKTDKDVVTIVDGLTGEILFEKAPK